MMKEVLIVADNILSPLGSTTDDNFRLLSRGQGGIRQQQDGSISNHPFYASLLDEHAGLPQLSNDHFSKFERLIISSVTEALKHSSVELSNNNTILIISSTKGNISIVENSPLTPALKTRIALHSSAKNIATHFNCAHTPLVVSNACISGVLAILVGKRLIQSGQYDYAVVSGADTISKFVVSGFQSFQAISPEPCRPFDAARNGISLGEGAGTVILSSTARDANAIKVAGGSVSNDANHISGPSRTGEELCQAITKAMEEARVKPRDIHLVSAHGTATVYNDEMEALAINLAGLQEASLNSLKGYYGHTLGAAGIIESIVSIESLRRGIVLPSKGFSEPGLSKPLNICKSLQHASLKNCLKTASGFGGCNAALVFSKV